MAAATGAIREDADIESSTEAYARRFSGSVGRWFLTMQARLTLRALAGLPSGSTVLDVGGGHAQVAPVLIDAGYTVTVAGSDSSCAARLRPWLDRGTCSYQVADLQSLPYESKQFDAVVCYRLMAHSVNWLGLISELCRVARHRVVLDYPSRRSLNLISDEFFSMKRRMEGPSTRRYLLYAPGDIRQAFAATGFEIAGQHPQFLLPMVVHRLVRSTTFSRVVEAPARLLGLTRLLGSPVIVRADRISASR